MQVKVSELHAGMVLNADTPIPNTKHVLSKGQKLTNEIIAAFVKTGLQAADITEASIPSTVAPKITVKIADNNESAFLSVEPAGNPNETLTLEMLMEHLSNAGVKAGVDEKVLSNVVRMWGEKKHRYDVSRAAVSREAEPGREGGLRLLVRGITSASDLDIIKSGKMYWQIKDVACQYQKVEPDMIIAQKNLAMPPVPGCDVRGEPIFTDEVVQCQVIIENGAMLSDDGKEVQSKVNGFVYLLGDRIGVVEIDFDGLIEIIPSTDRMVAKMEIHPPGEGGRMPDELKIKTMLMNQKILFGIRDELLNTLVFGFVNNEYPSEPVVIAEGIPAQNGENGRAELLFNVQSSLKPRENPDGSVDYKNVDIINSVSKGDKLVRLIPPTKGIPGRTIIGEAVKASDGASVKLPVGPNTEIDSKDPSYLIASIDGMVRYTGSVVEVSEGYVVKGDVDFNTGHIKYERSVVVTGDVKGGFNVECGGDLQIGGVIEDSMITVGGNILCKYGLVGQGKGVVEAAGDVNLGFMKNQTLKCRKDVNVAKEVLNSNIYARKSIHIHGKPLSVAGGYLVARDSITLHTVGNHSGIRTTLEVGVDYMLVEELKKTDSALDELTANYAKLNESQMKYTKIIGQKGTAATQEKAMVAKLVETMAKYKQQIASIEERKKLIIKKLYYFDNAHIKIEHAALPGTLFKFGERHFLVKDEVIGPKTVRLIDHEIKII
ncbi:MAG: DUF342 domain-containing protein [Fibrobacter sp.]|nr:DUF342 domain-containing protein [Fibrobacter sp.]